MSDQDSAMKRFMSDNEVFADAFNYFLYDGKKVIDPDSLTELDPNEIIFPDALKTLNEKQQKKKKEKQKGESIVRERDVLKLCAMKRCGNIAYCIMGIENQTYVNYAAPAIMLSYDFFNLFKQVVDIQEEHDLKKDLKDPDEFLSRFSREDRITAVISLVIFFSGKQWDGPLWLHEMYEDVDPMFKNMILDYKVNLIEPWKMNDEDFNKFETDLSDVLKLSKQTEDKEALKKFLDNGMDKDIGASALRVISSILEENITIEEGKKVGNVCKAMRELKEDWKNEGLEEGIEKGALNNLFENVKTLMKKMKLSPEEAMNVLDVSDKNRVALMKML